MNTQEHNPRAGTVESELDEQTFTALVRYVKCIVRIHYLGLVNGVYGTHSYPAPDGETLI
ncbi:MAG: hypothetical protein H6R26_613 [Proteobacteria bacterium]|nr:hypothetical protein [Pseudomonadota bacterium]